MLFSELGLAPELLRAVEDEGYVTPTPIQQQAIPLVLAGRDLLAAAQTGTGKTAAFALPILQRLLGAPALSPRPRVLVLVPTRELAAQVAESVAHLRSPSARALRRDLRRRRPRPAGRAAAPRRRHRRRHARPPARSHAATQRRPVRHRDPGARRGRPHARHGLHPRHPPHASAVLPKQRQTLLFSATFRDAIRTLVAGLLQRSGTRRGGAAQHRRRARRAACAIRSTRRARQRCWHIWYPAATGARCWCSPAPSTVPTAWPSSSSAPAWSARRSTATSRKAHAPRRWPISRPAACACWSPPTSPRAGWTSTSCRT